MRHDERRGGAEAWVLTTDGGPALLDEVSTVAAPGPADLARWRKACPAERVAAALRLVDGAGAGRRSSPGPIGCGSSRRGSSRPRPSRRPAQGAAVRGRGWSSTSAAGSAATPLALAAGGRGPGRRPSTQAMCRRARWNAGVYGVAERVAAVRAGPSRSASPPARWVHIDPDRRAGRRTRRPASWRTTCPASTSCKRLARPARGGAIKLGPASDFAVHFGATGYRDRADQPRTASARRRRSGSARWPLPPPRDAACPTGAYLDRPRRTAAGRGPVGAALRPGSSTPTRRSSARACSTRSPRRTA